MSDTPDENYEISLVFNDEAIAARVDARTHLGDFIRHGLGRKGTHIGCEHGVCGACNVLIDGRSVRSCLMLAVQADGCRVDTVEGLTASGIVADLQDEFVRRNALQCGYCTPGMLASIKELLDMGGVPDRAAIREHLSGNYCRCTGYEAIIDAVEAVAKARAGEAV
jgi:carbon-monoxide dehydrogenase small subunit